MSSPAGSSVGMSDGSKTSGGRSDVERPINASTSVDAESAPSIVAGRWLAQPDKPTRAATMIAIMTVVDVRTGVILCTVVLRTLE